jgi:hypothetical protein
VSDAADAKARVKLDLNNPEFQQSLFALEKSEGAAVIGTLRRIAALTWAQFYADHGLRWEQIHSYAGPKGEKRYSFRITKTFRAVAFREGHWLRVLGLHSDHDSAYTRH